MKTVFITGATSGFGKAIAERFAKEGYNLVVTGRRKERLDALQQQLETTYNIKVHTLCFDIRDNQACVTALASVADSMKEVEVLVNNAGGAWGRDRFEQALVEDWDQMLDTNVKGLMYISKAVVPYLIEKKSGHVVNIGSIAGSQPYEFGNGYNAAKFAVKGISGAMRIDLLPYNIRVTHVSPGAALTEFSLVRFKGDEEKAASMYKGYKPLLPEDIADIVYYAASLPPHVCLNEIEVTPTAQANSYHLFKQL